MFTGFLLFWFFLFTSNVAYEGEGIEEEERVVQPRLYGVKVDNRRSGHDRCVAPDCLCRVRPGAIPDPITTVLGSERRHSIYFLEGSGLFLNSQESRIQDAADVSSDISSASITLVGYTDGCGTATSNSNLARERINTVKIKILEIERIPADVYLIDASGSMWSHWRDWTDIVNISFQPGSRIYLATSERCVRNRSLDNVAPGGGTEIWYSYWKVLEYMSPGETLLIISDFDSDIPLTGSESETIRRKVSDRQVSVRAVSL